MLQLKKIFIYCVCHSSHLLQPLDVGVYKSAKSSWRGILKDFYQANNFKSISKENFPYQLKKLYERAFLPAHAIGGFKAAGLFPFNPAVIISDKIAVSLPLEKETISTTVSTADDTPLKSNQSTK
jgi:hypothetical protein